MVSATKAAHKIATWNINGFRSTDDTLVLNMIDGFDVVLLQETRLSEPGQIPLWLSSWAVEAAHGPRGRAGVMTLSRVPAVAVVKDPIRVPDASLGRSLLTVHDRFSMLNVYVPHGGRDHRDLATKVAFLESMVRFVLEFAGPPIVIAGDLNLAVAPIDTARPNQNRNSVLYLENVRSPIMSLLSNGYSDAFRVKFPCAEGQYTWWPYAYGARSRNVGWRLDYILLPSTLELLEASLISSQLGSDHCPVRTTFATSQEH